MDKKIYNNILILLFCGFLGVMFLLYLILPSDSFSEKEKRFLAEKPAFNTEKIFSGSFMDASESWAADHMPGRDFFVWVSAEADLLANLQVSKDVYIGENSRLFESPVSFSDARIRQNMEILNRFADSVSQPVDMLLIPSSGFLMSEEISGLKDPYEDDRIIRSSYALAGDHIRTLDLLSVYGEIAEPGSLFYKTDHHWTSRGAWLACRAYMEQNGKKGLKEEDYLILPEDGFYGSLYSRACLWQIPSDTIELWDSRGDFTVSFLGKEEKSESLFFLSHLDEPDKYPVWLDGNHPEVTIVNHNENAEGKLLVIRDSFANCLGCFLADSYSQVTMIDLRYYRESVSELCLQEGFDDILFVYSVRNYMTDSNIPWLD